MTDFLRPPSDTSTGKRVHASVHNDGVNDVYTQAVHVADRNNPDLYQAVDNKGAARVAFADGSPDFDAFGRTTVSEPNLMGMYKFYTEDYADSFSATQTGGGIVARDAVLQGMKLTCGTASGDIATYNSHRHYHYRPGNSMTLMWTMKQGDTGKANVVRRAGWITPDNGLYFEQNGLSDFNIVVRDGNLVTESKIERATWNGDRLDGTGGDNNLSGATLNLDDNNIWWIDFQFLGAGAVRFGTWVDGNKVVCHTEGHYGVLDRPYLSSPSLSFGFEQENIGVTGSTSEMHVFCAVVTNDGYDEFDVNPLAFNTEKTLTTTSFTPIISFRPTQTHNSVDNRDRIVPQLLSVLADSASIELIAEVNPTLTGATWADTIQGCEYDTAATVVGADGDKKTTTYVASGRSEAIDLTSIFKIYKDGVTRHFDVTASDHITISGRLLAAGSTLAAVAVNALEVE